MPGYGTLYIADPSLMGTKLFARILGIHSYEGIGRGSEATGVRFALGAGQVAMTFMPGDQMAEHLKGFSAFAEDAIEDRDQIVYVLARISSCLWLCCYACL